MSGSELDRLQVRGSWLASGGRVQKANYLSTRSMGVGLVESPEKSKRRTRARSSAVSQSRIYARPTDIVRAEHEVKKSRFIALLGPAPDRQAALDFVAECARRDPGARHVCYGYIAGNPHVGTERGSSDDGEPSGTAGQPILGVLDHSGLGEVVAVVIRHFGGVKLGAGGLVRAYASAVQQALEELPTEIREPQIGLRLEFGFEHENTVRHLAGEQGVFLEDPEYREAVHMRAWPTESVAGSFRRALEESARGQIRIEEETDH